MTASHTDTPVDLTTTYLGLTLRSPIVASPSPLTGTLDGIRRLARAGAGAIVLPSVFEEQVWRFSERLLARNPDGIGRLDRVSSYPPAPAVNLDDAADAFDLIRAAVDAVDVPIIASLNGGGSGGWPVYAHGLQQAGAAAIELNIYDIAADVGASAATVEDRYAEILASVKSVVTIPVAVKLPPWFSSVGAIATRLVDAGADGLVLFNRFLQPDIDPERLAVTSAMRLSSSYESTLPMTWIALLRGRVDASLAATTGVEGPADVARFLLAGADVVMTASAVLRHGPEYVTELTDGLVSWMRSKEFSTVDAVRGLLSEALGSDAASHRAGYVDVLQAGRRHYG
jgi:dihydroorotate dehydrogenase (fumarate)